MDYKTIIALEVKLDLDYDKITKEIMSVPESHWTTRSFDGYYWKSLSLTTNDIAPFKDFKSAKRIDHTEWYWDLAVPTPYLRSVLTSLPINHIGIVRVMLIDGYLPLHVDSDKNTPDDKSYYLGLSLFPILNDSLSIADTKLNCRSMFFNDKIIHGYPESTSRNLTIRIFGDFDYSKFNVLKIHTLSDEHPLR